MDNKDFGHVILLALALIAWIIVLFLGGAVQEKNCIIELYRKGMDDHIDIEEFCDGR